MAWPMRSESVSDSWPIRGAHDWPPGPGWRRASRNSEPGSELHPLERLDSDPEREDRPDEADDQADQDRDGQPEPELGLRERETGEFGVVLARKVEVAGHRQVRHDRADED